MAKNKNNKLAIVKGGNKVSRKARTPNELAFLIRELIKEAGEIAKKAATPYFLEAGALLMEARSGVGHGSWEQYVREHVRMSPQHAWRLMTAAADAGSYVWGLTLSTMVGNDGDKRPNWSMAVGKLLKDVDPETHDQPDDVAAIRQIKSDIINIGFEALREKFSPNKTGGSLDKTRRLAVAKRQLEESI